jgi:hypothetical protein
MIDGVRVTGTLKSITSQRWGVSVRFCQCFGSTVMSVMLNHGILKSGMFKHGILKGVMLNHGILKRGMLNHGILKRGILNPGKLQCSNV